MSDRHKAPTELSGWKQIAGYLGVTEPTARRYYRELGLPVDDRNGRYYAFIEQLDDWRNRRAESPQARSLPKDQGPELSQSTFALWAAASFVLVGAIVISVLALSSSSPQTVSIDGSVITALDAHSQRLWQRDVRELMPEAEPFISRSALVVDLDGDNRNEVAVTVLPTTQSETSRLMAFEDDGEVLWTFSNGDELSVRGRRFNPSYTGATPRWLDDSPQPWILNVAHHSIWYPTQVTLLHPTSGLPVLEYWHPGRIQSHTVADWDSDGRPELFLGGINNPGHGLGHPSLSILKVPTPGVTIATSNTFFRENNPREFAYLLFPTYDVFEVQRLGAGILLVERQSDGRLLVGIGIRTDAMVYQYLNTDLEVEEIRPSDGFLQEHKRLHVQGYLDHSYSPGELEAWREVVRFDSLPDGNSRRVEALFETRQPHSGPRTYERRGKQP